MKEIIRINLPIGLAIILYIVLNFFSEYLLNFSFDADSHPNKVFPTLFFSLIFICSIILQLIIWFFASKKEQKVRKVVGNYIDVKKVIILHWPIFLSAIIWIVAYDANVARIFFNIDYGNTILILVILTFVFCLFSVWQLIIWSCLFFRQLFKK